MVICLQGLAICPKCRALQKPASTLESQLNKNIKVNCLFCGNPYYYSVRKSKGNPESFFVASSDSKIDLNSNDYKINSFHDIMARR